jgi:hypothetical protein
MKTTVDLNEAVLEKLHIYMAATAQTPKDQSIVINELLTIALRGVPTSREVIDKFNAIRDVGK